MPVRKFPVAEGDSGIRLDRWFRRHFPRLPHARLERLVRTGQVRVDGGRVRSSTRLLTGQTIRVPPLENGEAAVPARRIDPVTREDRTWIRSLVLHEDEAVIALNKPPGMPVQGGVKAARNLDSLLSALSGSGEERPRLVHRLDRDTSGVLLVARDASAASHLASAFRGHDVLKTYWALVAGVPRSEEGVIDLPLRKRSERGGFELVAPDPEQGRPAVTGYRVADRAGDRIAWLVLTPRTGRTHQLRAHCAALGNPIIGDPKYGRGRREKAIPAAKGLHLHARALTFPHPYGSTVTVMAPLPPHMDSAWRALGFDPGTQTR